jgi:hypothetical protein
MDHKSGSVKVNGQIPNPLEARGGQIMQARDSLRSQIAKAEKASRRRKNGGNGTTGKTESIGRGLKEILISSVLYLGGLAALIVLAYLFLF